MPMFFHVNLKKEYKDRRIQYQLLMMTSVTSAISANTRMIIRNPVLVLIE